MLTEKTCWINLVFIILVALCLFSVLMSPFIYARTSCANLQEVAGVKTHWRWIGGCYVTLEDGNIVPYDRWIYLQERGE